MIGKYTSIDNHYKSVGDMLGTRVIANEKIDGSNFSVHIFDGGYQFRSRNQTANLTEGSLFYEAALIVEKQIDKLRQWLNSEHEHIVYFEIFGRGVQKRVNYDKYLKICPDVIKGRSVALIDVAKLPSNPEQKRSWYGPESLIILGGACNFWTPPQFVFESLKMKDIEELLEHKGVEGYILKTVDEQGLPVRNHYGDLKVVKVKTHEFTSYEKRGKEPKRAKPKTPPEIIDFLIERINFGRLHSVYSHGHENLKQEMSDMKFLPTIVLEDIRNETLGHEIWTQFEEKQIRKVVAHMLPRIMKSWFLEQTTIE